MMGRILPAMLLAALCACSYRPGYDDPVMRRLSWFSYVGAADVREACAAGGPERYRFVYNGDYDQQIRAYDILVDAAGGAVMKARVRGTADLGRGFALMDPLGPWRGDEGDARLAPEDVARLRAALERSGLSHPGPEGLRLVSNEHYWVAVACRDGRFRLNAWKYPSDRYAALRFPGFLVQHDPTGVPINPPEDRSRYPNPPPFERVGESTFEFRLADNRLIGASGYFGR